MICFKAIYLERGYRQRDVAQLILEKNLFGLDIDGARGAADGLCANDEGGGLMIVGFFERGVELNVMSLVDSKGFDAERLAQSVKLATYGLTASDLTELKRLFEHALDLWLADPGAGRTGCEAAAVEAIE